MIATLLKEHKPEFKIYISIVVGIIIFAIAADQLKDFIYLINKLTQRINVNQNFVGILLKLQGLQFWQNLQYLYVMIVEKLQ